jgi:tetratricopeptide (TPR) repeat protein
LLFQSAKTCMAQPIPNHSDRRLDSWKEIASFFGRDERTVRRWEKENALPVRRVPGGTKGRVFAYESELRRWLSIPQVENSVVPLHLVKALPDHALPHQKPDHPAQSNPPHADSSARLHPAFAISICAILTAGLLFYAAHHHFVVNASATPARQLREAEDFYLQGRYFWNKRTPEDLTKAVDLFTQAIVRDPAYAKAYVGLADCYNLLREYSAMPPEQAYPRALSAAKKAVELDDTSAEAHASLAFVTFYWSWDANTAEREFKRAIALNPEYSTAHHWYATFLLSLHRLPEAAQEIEEARKLDPSSQAIIADQGFILYHSGKTEPGVAQLKELETSDPAFLSPHIYLAEIYGLAGDYPNFLKESRHVAELRHDSQELQVVSAAESGYAAGGVPAMWQATLDAQLRLHAAGAMSSFALAQTYARLGRNQQALEYLHQAYDQHDDHFVFIGVDPALVGLRGDPAFNDLLALSRQTRAE